MSFCRPQDKRNRLSFACEAQRSSRPLSVGTSTLLDSRGNVSRSNDDQEDFYADSQLFPTQLDIKRAVITNREIGVLLDGLCSRASRTSPEPDVCLPKQNCAFQMSLIWRREVQAHRELPIAIGAPKCGLALFQLK